MRNSLWMGWLAVSLAFVPAAANAVPKVDVPTSAAAAKTLQAAGPGWTLNVEPTTRNCYSPPDAESNGVVAGFARIREVKSLT